MKIVAAIIQKITFLLLLSGMVSHAQQNEMDSLLKSGTLEIYEHPDKAIKIGQQIVVSEKSSIRLKIKGFVMISDAYSSKRDYRKSVEYLIKAQNLSNRIDNTIVKIQILTKTATQYQQLRIYDKAIQYLDQARALSLDYPDKDSIRSVLGTNYSIRGLIYKEQLNCDIAIGYFDKGITEYKKLKTPIKNANLSIVSYNKGNCYILLSDNVLARKSFEESIAYAKIIDAKSLLAFAQKGLAQVYTLEGKYENAISELTEAVNISAAVGDLVLNQGLYKELSENYLAINEWENYQKFQNLYLETQQKITESERKSVGISLNEQQKILDTQAAELKTKYLFLIGVLLIVLIFIVFLIVRNYKKSEKAIENLKKTIKSLQEFSREGK